MSTVKRSIEAVVVVVAAAATSFRTRHVV